jgi:hypothetical protein
MVITTAAAAPAPASPSPPATCSASTRYSSHTQLEDCSTGRPRRRPRARGRDRPPSPGHDTPATGSDTQTHPAPTPASGPPATPSTHRPTTSLLPPLLVIPARQNLQPLKHLLIRQAALLPLPIRPTRSPPRRPTPLSVQESKPKKSEGLTERKSAEVAGRMRRWRRPNPPLPLVLWACLGLGRAGCLAMGCC